MTATLLVGYDEREGGQDALALAALLALAGGARLVVASIFSVRPSAPAKDREQRRGAAARQAAAGLDKLAGTAIETRAIATGAPSPDAGLRRLADELGAELVVVGQSHRGALGRVFPGGTGEHLLASSRRSVGIPPRGFAVAWAQAALLPPPWLARIGVAYDGWRESRAALRFASSLARRSGAQLQLLMVADPRSITAVAPSAADLDTIMLGHREVAETLLGELLEALPHVPPVAGAVLEGEPGAALQVAAEQRSLDLVVVGCRDRGPLGWLLPGSVSRRLVHSAACPVIVVPSRDEPPRHGVGRDADAADALGSPTRPDAASTAGGMRVRERRSDQVRGRASGQLRPRWGGD